MRKTIAASLGAVATVTMITGAGVAAASASHPATTHRASSRAPITGWQHFQAISSSLTSSKSPVLAYGVFNASGTDTQTGLRTDTFAFPGGSFRVTHNTTRRRSHFSRRTCAEVIHQRGIYKLSRGTGKYAGISGHGRYRLRFLIVARRTASGGCSQKPIGEQIIIRARGPVTLP
jgi:hypothetical protein